MRSSVGRNQVPFIAMCPVFNRGGWGAIFEVSLRVVVELRTPHWILCLEGPSQHCMFFKHVTAVLSTQDVCVSKHRPVWCQWVDILFHVQTGVSAARRLVRPRFVAAVINQIWPADSPSCVYLGLLVTQFSSLSWPAVPFGNSFRAFLCSFTMG